MNFPTKPRRYKNCNASEYIYINTKAAQRSQANSANDAVDETDIPKGNNNKTKDNIDGICTIV